MSILSKVKINKNIQTKNMQMSQPYSNEKYSNGVLFENRPALYFF